MPFPADLDRDPHRRKSKATSIEQPFAASNWPPVSPRLVEFIDKYVQSHVPAFGPGMTGDDALGGIATHGGMVYLANALRKVEQGQARVVEKTAIRTHLNKE